MKSNLPSSQIPAGSNFSLKLIMSITMIFLLMMIIQAKKTWKYEIVMVTIQQKDDFHHNIYADDDYKPRKLIVVTNHRKKL